MHVSSNKAKMSEMFDAIDVDKKWDQPVGATKGVAEVLSSVVKK